MNLVYSLIVPFLIISISSELATSESVYFIRPSLCSTAMEQPCLTLSEFAVSAGNGSNSNITLIIMPGSHNLHSSLNLTNVNKLSMLSESSKMATITCQETAKVLLRSIGQVHMENMSFIGCGGNEFHLIGQALIQNTMFKGQENSTSALRLTGSTAQIVNSSFAFNSCGTYTRQIIDNNIWYVGGAIMVFHSNISIINSRFEHNNAELGGAIFAEQHSNITVVASTFTGNEGDSGGVFFVRANCSIMIRECQFTSNRAIYYSDVVDSGHGGVGIFIYSVVCIYDSIFSNNTAYNAGALLLFRSRVNISMSQFIYNDATSPFSFGWAGAIYIESANVVMDRTVFRHNKGALQVYEDANVVITDSEFTHNTESYTGACLVQDSTLRSNGFLVVSENSGTIATFYFVNSTANFTGSVMFSHNVNSFYVFYNSYITFQDQATFTHTHSESMDSYSDFTGGGAMTVHKLSLIHI